LLQNMYLKEGYYKN